MKPEFSERTYESAFMDNFIAPFRPLLWGPVIYPNTLDEYFLGYDAKVIIGHKKALPYHFQFKIPEIKNNPKARKIGNSKKMISPPYYRMHLYKKDSYHQQRTLTTLEKRFPNLVFYASPAFHKNSELVQFYSKNRICNESALFSPMEISKLMTLPTKKGHNVVYDKVPGIAFFCSDPIQIKKHRIDEVMKANKKSDKKMMTLEEISDSIFQVLNELGVESNREDFTTIVNYYVDMIPRYFSLPEDLHIRAAKVKAMKFLVRTYLDCEMCFVIN